MAFSGKPVPNPQSFVVIGAGQAGGRAVEAMRREGFAGRIVMVGDELYPPYERPPLSKRLLIGDDGPEQTFLHDMAYYRDADIELRLGIRALAIDRAKRRVMLADGDALSYDKLLIATGSRVRRISIPGADLAGVSYLRNIDDSLALRAQLHDGARLVVVGGGYIGLEVAAAARTRGCHVTVLEMESVPMARVVAPEIGSLFADIHRGRGVDIRTGVTVAEFIGSDRIERVLCSDGSAFAADHVVVGIGIVPNSELAAEAGLTVGNGIVVDEHGRTSDPDIFAAGDVSYHPNALLGRSIRLESWQNAQNQAIAVAGAMCGNPQAYAEIPWFWSDQYDLNLQMAGMTSAWDALVYRGDVEARKFTVFYMQEGVVVAANAVNSPRDLRFARMMIERKCKVDQAALGDTAVRLKSLITP